MDKRKRAAEHRRRCKENGPRMRVTRAALNITEQQAADGYGVTLKTYLGYEAGKQAPRTKPTLKFAELYNVSLD